MAEEKTELSEPQKEINGLVEKAQKALEDYASFDQEKIDYIVAKASVAALDHHGSLAKLAVEETKRGVFEDKATKNLFACEYVVNHMRHLKTVGVVEDDDVTGIVKIAEPVGVVAGLTPVTNPTSTAIFKALICLKTRNPIIFSFHPSAIKCSIAAAKSFMTLLLPQVLRKTVSSGLKSRQWKRRTFSLGILVLLLFLQLAETQWFALHILRENRLSVLVPETFLHTSKSLATSSRQ